MHSTNHTPAPVCTGRRRTLALAAGAALAPWAVGCAQTAPRDATLDTWAEGFAAD